MVQKILFKQHLTLPHNLGYNCCAIDPFALLLLHLHQTLEILITKFQNLIIKLKPF